MKKIFSVFVLIGCLMSIDAYAGCKLLSCGSFSWYEPNAWIHADSAGNQCWGCGLGANSCGNRDVVPYLDALGDIVGLFQCTFGFKNSFENYEPGVFCDDSELKAASLAALDLTNAKKTYKLKGRATGSSSLGDWDVFSGGAACIYVKCNAGFMPDANNTKCVLDTRGSTCTNSGGVWQNGFCVCDSAKFLKQNAAKTECECVSSDYEYVVSSGKCEETAASRQRRQVTSNKQKCEASFGTWSGGKCVCDTAKNLIQDTNVTCKCKDANYERNNSTKSCELTKVAIREQACKAAASSGASWNGTECVCNDSKKEWTGAKCEYPVGYVQCQAVAGATWDAVSKQCVCNDETKVFDGTKCVETEEAKQKRIYGAATKSISSAVGKLDSFVDGLEVSKWKDEEGEFNTARLASDSIAGVVLGTAGGLITSNIVKKHQVEEGFENLNCTIGGQTVAGWGDEFIVGVQ